MGSNAVTREQIAAIARTWIGTPYRLRGRVKGAGCDCVSFLFEVFREAGFITTESLGHYSHDWFHHAKNERYLLGLIEIAKSQIEQGERKFRSWNMIVYPSSDVPMGALILTRTAGSRRYNHGAIALRWPKAIHCMSNGVEEFDMGRAPAWHHQEVFVLDPFAQTETRA